MENNIKELKLQYSKAIIKIQRIADIISDLESQLLVAKKDFKKANILAFKLNVDIYGE